MDLRRLLHGRAHQAHAAGAPELRGRPAPARLRVPGHKRRAGRADGGAAVPAAQLHRCPRRSLRAELPGDGRAEGRRREPPGDDAHQGNRGRRAADHLPHLPPGVPRRRERQEAAGLRPRVPPGVHRRLAPVEAPVPDVPPRRLLASYRPAGDGACVARRRRGPSR